MWCLTRWRTHDLKKSHPNKNPSATLIRGRKGSGMPRHGMFLNRPGQNKESLFHYYLDTNQELAKETWCFLRGSVHTEWFAYEALVWFGLARRAKTSSLFDCWRQRSHNWHASGFDKESSGSFYAMGTICPKKKNSLPGYLIMNKE